MLDLTKLPILLNEYNDTNGVEYLSDNPDYSELFTHKQKSYSRLKPGSVQEDYLIVYSYIHNIKAVANELIENNVEFEHVSCHLSDESYLLINENQEL